MKKLLFIFLFSIFGFFTSNAQFNVGVNAGLPLGDIGDYASFNVSLDVGYFFKINDVISLGPITGYSHSFAKEFNGIKGDDVQYIPVAAAGRFQISELFSAGIDIGYAIGLNEGNDGDIYYRPRIAFSVSENIELALHYTGIGASSEETTTTGNATITTTSPGFSIVGLGATYKFL
ncbi:MAG: hypothetical protein L3J09_00830 [Flavobacteriaceae bacterium]|nr:hypothetical protein [Flavobacteriaceae bacterium]